jgi:hypothetical protein
MIFIYLNLFSIYFKLLGRRLIVQVDRLLENTLKVLLVDVEFLFVVQRALENRSWELVRLDSFRCEKWMVLNLLNGRPHFWLKL